MVTVERTDTIKLGGGRGAGRRRHYMERRPYALVPLCSCASLERADMLKGFEFLLYCPYSCFYKRAVEYYRCLRIIRKLISSYYYFDCTVTNLIQNLSRFRK
jgi:hypothetical protein